MKLNDLKPAPGAKKTRRRVGRGIGSGTGKTAGRGQKGQKSRSGYSKGPGWEGGRSNLIERLPKRGFNNNQFRTFYQIVNLSDLNKLDAGSDVTAESLKAAGIVRHANRPVKLLGNGSLEVSGLSVELDNYSQGAMDAIAANGGTIRNPEVKAAKEATGKKAKGNNTTKAVVATESYVESDSATEPVVETQGFVAEPVVETESAITTESYVESESATTESYAEPESSTTEFVSETVSEEVTETSFESVESSGISATSTESVAPVSDVSAIGHAAVSEDEAQKLMKQAEDEATEMKRRIDNKEIEADDLKVISGVGPVMEGKLNDLGFYTYQGVATMSAAQKYRLVETLDGFGNRIERDEWIPQAGELHYQKYGERLPGIAEYSGSFTGSVTRVDEANSEPEAGDEA